MIDSIQTNGALVIFSAAATTQHASVTKPEHAAALEAHFRGKFSAAAGGRLVTLSGAYKGQEEISYIVPHADYLEILRDGLLNSVLRSEETALILTARRDVRGRREALLINPVTFAAVADLGYLGNVPEKFARQCDGWSYDGASYFVAMSADDWRQYEAIEASGDGAALLRPDWRELRRAWVNPAHVAAAPVADLEALANA